MRQRTAHVAGPGQPASSVWAASSINLGRQKWGEEAETVRGTSGGVTVPAGVLPSLMRWLSLGPHHGAGDHSPAGSG